MTRKNEEVCRHCGLPIYRQGDGAWTHYENTEGLKHTMRCFRRRSVQEKVWAEPVTR